MKTKKLLDKLIPRRLLLPSTLVLFAPAAMADTRVWTGAAPAGPATLNWSNPGNWAGGIFAQSGDTAVFPAGASSFGPIIQNMDESFSDLDLLQFNAPGYTINELPFYLTTGINLNFPGSGTITLNNAVQLEAACAFSVTGSQAILLLNEILFLNANTLTVSGSGVVNFSGPILGDGNLVKNGAGRAELNAATKDTGTVTLSGGTLLCNHATMTKPVSMVAATVLGGTGTVAAVTATGGTIRPGVNGTGMLHATGAVSMNSVTEFEILLGHGIPSEATKLRSATGVTLGGSILLLNLHANYTPLIGVPLVLVDNQSASPTSGTFSGLPQNASILKGGTTFKISYTGGTGNDVTLTPISVAPSGIERVWTGAVDSSWSTPGNWDGGVAPKPGDRVQFPEVDAAKKATVNTFPAGYPLDLVRLTAGGYTLGGAILHLGDGIVQQAPAGADGNLIAFSLANTPSPAPAFTTRVRLQSGGDLEVSPVHAFSLPHPGSILALHNDQVGPMLTSKIKAYGSGKVTKSGIGAASVQAVSSQAGGTHVDAGLLLAPVAAALGNSPITVAAGATLDIGKALGLPASYNNSLELTGSLRITDHSAAQTWNGTIEIPSGSTGIFENRGNSFLINGNIGGGGAVGFRGTGTTTVSGPLPNVLGPATVDGGHVILDKDDDQIGLGIGLTVKNGGFFISVNQDAMLPGGTLTVDHGSAEFQKSQGFTTVTLGGGTLLVPNGLEIASLTSTASAEPSVIRGTLHSASPVMTWDIADGAASPDVDYTGNINTPAFPLALTKSGPGTLFVSNGAGTDHPLLTLNIPTGTVTWNDLPDTPAAFGPVVNLTGGTLGGTGRVREISSGPGSSLSPGDGIGSMTSAGVALRSDSTFRIDINGAGDPALHDALHAQGIVDITGAALAPRGTPFDYQKSILIIDNDGADPINGNFAGLPEGGTLVLGNTIVKISYFGGDGNDAVLSRILPPAASVKEIEYLENLAAAGDSGAPPVYTDATGLAGFSYALEVSEDLVVWETVVTAVADINGTIRHEWLPTTHPPRRFFRIRSL